MSFSLICHIMIILHKEHTKSSWSFNTEIAFWAIFADANSTMPHPLLRPIWRGGSRKRCWHTKFVQMKHKINDQTWVFVFSHVSPSHSPHLSTKVLQFLPSALVCKVTYVNALVAAPLSITTCSSVPHVFFWVRSKPFPSGDLIPPSTWARFLGGTLMLDHLRGWSSWCRRGRGESLVIWRWKYNSDKKSDYTRTVIPYTYNINSIAKRHRYTSKLNP